MGGVISVLRIFSKRRRPRLGYHHHVVDDTRSIPAHFACSEHEHRWQAQDPVCHDRHQGYRPSLRHPCVQEGRRRPHQAAGELSDEDVEKIMVIMANPLQYKIPSWFLNRQKDVKDGKYSQVISNSLETKIRDDLERLKKIRAHRGLRHYWGLRVRGQHTKTTGHR